MTNLFSQDDLNRIRSVTFVDRVDYHDELGSTNDRAIELALQENLQLPTLVLANRQTAGRGRRDRGWWSGAGGLTFSLILDRPTGPQGGNPATCISLLAALAVARALSRDVALQRIGLKWPNDVLLDERKACGILVESPAPHCSDISRRYVVGVGINVNNRAATAPAELRDKVVSLRDALGHPADTIEVLTNVLDQIALLRQQHSRGTLDLPALWRPFCRLLGRRVEMEGGQHLIGVCQGIDADGALCLDTPDGLRHCVTGSIARID